MTEKRFTSQRTDDYNFSDILDNGEWIGICHVDCEDDFVNKFNELAEENEQLKKECYGNLDGLNYYQEQIGYLSSKISDLECENEQLKERNDFLRKQLDRVCIDNETMGDKLKQIGRIL